MLPMKIDGRLQIFDEAARQSSLTHPRCCAADRPVRDARVSQAIGQSFDWLVPAKAEVFGARVADRPAAFPLAELEQRASASVVDRDVFRRRLRPRERRHQHRDCLDHVLICGERHLRRILTLYSLYYNRRARTWGWPRTRRYDDPSNDLGPSSSHRSCPDCIIATRGYDFREGQVPEIEGELRRVASATTASPQLRVRRRPLTPVPALSDSSFIARM